MLPHRPRVADRSATFLKLYRLTKELLKEMLSILNDAISNKEPVKKGFLSKFAGVLQRNEWITAPVATFFLEYFLSQ